jgi:hypothetical protein
MRGVVSRREPLTRLAASLGFVMFAASARADPITLERGAMDYSRSNQAFVRWSASGFEASGNFGDSASESWTPRHACNPCTAGQVINPSVSESLSNADANRDVGVGIVFRLNGANYLSRSLDFRIDAGDVVLGDVPPGAGLGVSTTAPFRFSGVLTGILDGSNGHDVEVALTGRGRAQVGTHPDGHWAFTLYAFEPAAPIPEPGTILLLGTTGLGLAARLRRRSRHPGTGVN